MEFSRVPARVSDDPTNVYAAGRIGTVEIANRLVMPAIATGLGDADGFMGPAVVARCEAGARAGAGLITVAAAAIDDDGSMPGLRALRERLHRAGARCAIRVGQSSDGRKPQEIGAEEMSRSVGEYVKAATRAAQAGFDIVELAACGSSLIAQLLSPGENGRADAHGGTLENRARFLLEILRALCRELPGLPVIVCLDDIDCRAGGLDLEESVRVARWAAAAGAAAIHVAGGFARALPPVRFAFTFGRRRAGFLDHAARIRAETTVPLIAGPVADHAAANRALGEGKADFVTLRHD